MGGLGDRARVSVSLYGIDLLLWRRCLIPVFALGRAQELLLILDEYWAMHPELQDVPIYYASSLAKKCMSVYQTYINAMNDKIKRQINVSNPFVFKHISNLKVRLSRFYVFPIILAVVFFLVARCCSSKRVPGPE